jgi:NTE family protein
MLSSPASAATRFASTSLGAEPHEALESASPGLRPGLIRRALLKLIGSAERSAPGQGREPGSDLSARPEAPLLEIAQPLSDMRRLSLALQGGGVLGAFTWGVLDRLLQEDDLELDAVSGASAGAINAVLLASGLARGGPDEARGSLERFWSSIGESSAEEPVPASRAGRGHREPVVTLSVQPA